MNAHPGTVLDAIRLLEAEGFGASFVFTDGALRCGVCGDAHRTEGALVAAVYRFEGPSDPEEEAVVYAVRCPSCGAGGSIVSAYGPGADPAMTDRLVMLDSRFVDRPGSQGRAPRHNGPDAVREAREESLGGLNSPFRS